MRFKYPIFVSTLLCLFMALGLQAQDNLSWKKHAKLAESLFNNAQYEEAGEHYRSAWKKKTKKKELIYKAGESFYLVRDYANAVDCWQHVKDDIETDPMIGLKYARVLKQNGQYEAASSELVNFLSNYKGDDKGVVSLIVQNEIRGCELAAQMASKGDDVNIRVEHLGSNINAPETEFAPFPYGEEVLYFSSTMGHRAEIYRSLKANGEWAKATPIENFPAIEDKHFCNGTLTPDTKRFYFTICENEEAWGGMTTRCQIYVTQRVGKTWAAPQKLPDYINEPGVSTTHPWVVHDGNTEILYFASNKSGGNGGMDIWYSTREINSNANDFTLPINAGTTINTRGDEITPYYDAVEGVLYFASNGQVSIGGFDIMKSKGARSNWQRAENVGTPINSPADDFFFVKTSSGKGGFFVSNRTFGTEKLTTTDEDIFEFEYLTPTRQWFAKGEVYNRQTGSQLSNVEIALYEIMSTGRKRFISKEVSEDGAYNFSVEPSKKYLLEAIKEGYASATYEFDTYDFATYTDFGAPIYMNEEQMIGGSEPVAEKEKPADPVVNKPKTSTPPVTQPTKEPAPPVLKETKEAVAANEPEKPLTDTPPVESKEEKAEMLPADNPATTEDAGTGYKIQIIALSKLDLDHPRFKNVKKFGQLESEFFEERGLYRVMIGGYSTVADAVGDLKTIRSYKDFSDAFIVEYKNGKRMSVIQK
ncbi:MAG: hypothetical protein Kow0027_11400 [Saprospiraceae bacterium]